jgi:hypothetical protein
MSNDDRPRSGLRVAGCRRGYPHPRRDVARRRSDALGIENLHPLDDAAVMAVPGRSVRALARRI